MSAVIELSRTEIAPTQVPYNLLMVAVEKGADVAQLTVLMDLQERWDKEQARKAYHAARSRFQELCPEIHKDKDVSYGAGKTAYKYATLPAIISQTKQALAQCGLTFRWEIDDKGADHMIGVTCIVSHIDGHSESNSMTGFPDESGSKNAIQARGSCVSYLQRYTLIGALGIASANDDDDGRASGQQNVERLIAHNAAVREWLDSIQCIKTCIGTQQWQQAVEAWHEIPDDDKGALWLAPSKGGVFTTAEIAAFKCNEWAAARREMYGETK